MLDDNLWSNKGYYRFIDFDFRLLNHNLGCYDVHDWSHDFKLRLFDDHFRLLVDS